VKLFRRKRVRPSPLPDLEPVDHSLADSALESAVEAHQAAQQQATQARQVVADLKQVNLRNGFAPAIRDSFERRYGGAI
jgi:signal transduction histidine kinase